MEDQLLVKALLKSAENGSLSMIQEQNSDNQIAWIQDIIKASKSEDARKVEDLLIPGNGMLTF